MGRMAELAQETEEQERESGLVPAEGDGPWVQHGDGPRCVVCDAPLHDGACLWCAVPTSAYVPDHTAAARAHEVSLDEAAGWDEEDQRVREEEELTRRQHDQDILDGYPSF